MEKDDNDDMEQPDAKKPRRECHFDKNWPNDFPGIGRSTKGMCRVYF